mmetsp:Transcript_10630/g.27823  ORF Transcript_10630/g.27823 Transcript_10630/m.27823 type:complete len:324 (-) Transcript_10630:322-1293(-)
MHSPAMVPSIPYSQSHLGSGGTSKNSATTKGIPKSIPPCPNATRPFSGYFLPTLSTIMPPTTVPTMSPNVTAQKIAPAMILLLPMVSRKRMRKEKASHGIVPIIPLQIMSISVLVVNMRFTFCFRGVLSASFSSALSSSLFAISVACSAASSSVIFFLLRHPSMHFSSQGSLVSPFAAKGMKMAIKKVRPPIMAKAILQLDTPHKYTSGVCSSSTSPSPSANVKSPSACSTALHIWEWGSWYSAKVVTDDAFITVELPCGVVSDVAKRVPSTAPNARVEPKIPKASPLLPSRTLSEMMACVTGNTADMPMPHNPEKTVSTVKF